MYFNPKFYSIEAEYIFSIINLQIIQENNPVSYMSLNHYLDKYIVSMFGYKIKKELISKRDFWHSRHFNREYRVTKL